MNDKAGLAFYLHLRDRFNASGKNFNVDSFPTSESFKDKICERLESPLNFLKFKFIKKGRGLDKVSQKTLYEKYVDWSIGAMAPESKGAFVSSPYTNVKFNQCLKTLRSVEKKEIRIDKKRLVAYSVTLEDLKAEFESRGWIHELDEIDVDDGVDGDDGDDDVVDDDDDDDDDDVDVDVVVDVPQNLDSHLDSGIKPFASCGNNIVTFD